MGTTTNNPPAVFIVGDEEVHADSCHALDEAAANGAVRMRAFSRRSYPGDRLPEDTLNEVCTVGYWDTPKKQNWGLDWHFNEGIEFTFLDAGTLDFAVDGATWQLKPGDLTISRPWQRHRVGNPNLTPSRLFWFILDVGVRHPHTAWQWPDWILLSPAELQTLTDRLRGNESPVLSAGSSLADHFRSLLVILENKQEFPETRFKLWVNQLLLELQACLEHADQPLDQSLSSAERTVKMVLDTVADFPEREWTLDGMAREAGMARTRFGECCKRISNRTPMDFLAQRRIDKAVSLMRKDTTPPLAEVAAACGFHSPQYFSNQFKRRIGQSPKSWLESLDDTSPG